MSKRRRKWRTLCILKLITFGVQKTINFGSKKRWKITKILYKVRFVNFVFFTPYHVHHDFSTFFFQIGLFPLHWRQGPFFKNTKNRSHGSYKRQAFFFRWFFWDPVFDIFNGLGWLPMFFCRQTKKARLTVWRRMFLTPAVAEIRNCICDFWTNGWRVFVKQ